MKNIQKVYGNLFICKFCFISSFILLSIFKAAKVIKEILMEKYQQIIRK